MLLPVTADDLKHAAGTIKAFSETLDKYADKVSDSGMEAVHYHWVMFRDTTLPGLHDFLDELGTAISKQIRAHDAGKKNPYVFSKEKAAKDTRRVSTLEQQLVAAETEETKAAKKAAGKKTSSRKKAGGA